MIHTYVRDPVRLGLRHLYQVEFCSFIVRYPTAGASVYCGHISSFFTKNNVVGLQLSKEPHIDASLNTYNIHFLASALSLASAVSRPP